MTAEGTEVTLQECPGGPLLVRGAQAWTGQDGVRHPVDRPVVAVCRCGASGLAPWCDSSHRMLKRNRPRPAGS